MLYLRSFASAVAAAILLVAVPAAATSSALTVTRATLANGLRVVVVHDPLAPVVTTMLNYRVGSDEQWIAGLAHATEHMMFRGSRTVSSSQFMEAIGITGGDFDADTSNAVTQYYFTVPSQYLDIALRLERSRATGLLMAADQWAQERKAITQEVTRDNSDAFHRLYVKMQDRLLGGTPYAKNGLGTVAAFAHDVNSEQLLRFYHLWYHPNNAIYVIAGDVDGPATIAQVKALFGDVPSAPLPPRPAVKLQPLHAALYHDVSDQAYTVVLLGYRFPGYDSPDYAASQNLGDVLSNPRSALGELAYTGAALGTQFSAQPFAKAGIALLIGVVPATTPPQTIDARLRSIVEAYQKTGVPADLVAAAKLREIAQLEFGANSIDGLADEWSDALAVQGISSPDDMRAAFERVSAADVDRVLRRYLDNRTVVTAYAVPKSAGAASTSSQGLAKEDNVIPPTSREPLPDWAQHVLDNVAVPPQTLAPTDTTLPNGVRLIVQPETISHTVVVSGEILNDPQVQEPAGQEGIADVTDGLFPFGTTTYGRVAFQQQLDDIAASTSAGTQFGLDVLAPDFDRGMQLLADQELHPAFDPQAFAIVREQTAGELAGEATTPDHLASVALAKALYPPGDPEQRFASAKSVDALTLDDVKAWYASAYRPDLTTIVVIGDTTPDQAKAVVEKYFGDWNASGPKPNVYPSPVPPNAPQEIAVPAAGRVQSAVELVETTQLRRTDPQWAPLQLANTVLSGGFSSLLYHDLREVHGYAYSVDSDLYAGKHRSTFSVDYGCDPANVLPAQEQVLAILRELASGPIDAQRMLQAKAMLMGDVPIREASYDGVTQQLLGYALQGLPLDEATIDARAELAASPASVQSAVARYIRPGAFIRLVTGPAGR